MQTKRTTENSRFKFRLWDGRKMYHDVNVGYSNPSIWIGDDWVEAIPDSIIMQCTGLKDNNGVDIYEGDILVWSSLAKGIVEYLEGDLCWETRDIYGNMNGIDCIRCSYYEVIGNIYEHPHLLEEKNEERS